MVSVKLLMLESEDEDDVDEREESLESSEDEEDEEVSTRLRFRMTCWSLLDLGLYGSTESTHVGYAD
jgi:hypothetical protein